MISTLDDSSGAPAVVPAPLRGVLRFCEWQLLLDLGTESARSVADRLGLTVQGVYARLRAVRRRLNAAGLDGDQLVALLRNTRGSTRPLSGLRKLEQAELSRCFGDTELASTPRTAATYATMRRLGAAARRRCRGQ